jgi:competence protein ComEC
LALLGFSLLSITQRWVWTVGLILIFLFLGLGYQGWLDRNRLLVLSEDFFIFSWLEYIRIQFEDVLAQVLPYPHSSLASGLIVGIKSGFPKDLRQAAIVTGTIHIVAISGFNVTLIIRIFSDWIKAWGRKESFFIGTLVIIIFVILVGGQASVVRAGIMGWLFMLARFLYRQPYILNALLFSASLMALQEPEILTDDIGFQLSFTAMLGLIYISPIVQLGVERWRGLNWLPKMFKSALIETLGAQIMVAPLIIFYFERISPLSPIPNLLILPFIIVPMVLGFLAGVLGWLWLPLAKLIAYPLFYFLEYFLRVIEGFSRVPGASREINLGWWGLVGIYVLLTCVIVLLSNKLKAKMQDVK